jgi:pre-mRNA 3'-end-processing factor FIP1
MASDHEQEDGDDDLYGDDAEQKQETKKEADTSGDEPMDEGASAEDDDDDSDDSDDNIEIIIDKPTAPKPVAQPTPESKAIKIEAPQQPATASAPAPAPRPAATGTVPQLSTVPSTVYPAQKTSTIDVNGNPVYPPQDKPLLQVDMDADLAEEQKIWRQPGQDQSDFFNYGFDEFTWEIYRQRQLAMSDTLQTQKNDLAQMQQMMGPGMPAMPGMGGPGGNNAPSGPAVGSGDPDQQQMQLMFQQMMAQGMDPSQMDFGSFMQMAGGPGGGFGGPGGQGGFQGNQGGGGGRGRGGRGRGGW